MTKTSKPTSGDEEDNIQADNTYHDIDYNWGFSTGTLRHMPNLVTVVSDVDEHALMFANLGWEARKHLNPNGGRWPEIIRNYGKVETWEDKMRKQLKKDPTLALVNRTKEKYKLYLDEIDEEDFMTLVELEEELESTKSLAHLMFNT